jgi:hypothetical protein
VIVEDLDGGEEGIHIDVEDGARGGGSGHWGIVRLGWIAAGTVATADAGRKAKRPAALKADHQYMARGLATSHRF